MSYPIDPNNRLETRASNGITYKFEYLEDGWIAIYEYNQGIPLKPLIQAMTEDKALEYIIMREPVPVNAQRLC